MNKNKILTKIKRSAGFLQSMLEN